MAGNLYEPSSQAKGPITHYFGRAHGKRAFHAAEPLYSYNNDFSIPLVKISGRLLLINHNHVHYRALADEPRKACFYHMLSGDALWIERSISSAQEHYQEALALAKVVKEKMSGGVKDPSTMPSSALSHSYNSGAPFARAAIGALADGAVCFLKENTPLYQAICLLWGEEIFTAQKNRKRFKKLLRISARLQCCQSRLVKV